ncbi:reverse transcriptase domain-containing protein [Tanacetum coccineum]
MLKRCEDTNLSLNWEKSHFMVREGIVLGHKISKSGLEVDRAKVEVIAKLPHPTSVKGGRCFHGQRLLQWCRSLITLKRRLTEAPILIAPDWDLPFELMCDASDFAIGAVLGQRKNKHFQPIHYASKTMNEAQTHYHLTTEKAFDIEFEQIKRSWKSRRRSSVQTRKIRSRQTREQEINDAFLSKLLVDCSSRSKYPGFADLQNYMRGIRDKTLVSGKKLSTFSKLATVDLLGDTMVPITQQEKSSIQDSIGPPSTRMPMTLSPVVTFVNVKENYAP